MNKKIADPSIPKIPAGAKFQRWFGRNLIRVYMVIALLTYLSRLPTRSPSPLMMLARAT